MGDGMNVETGGLTDFSRAVHADTDVFLGPATDRAQVQFREGVLFGQGNASDAVKLAKENYATALGISLQNLEQYVKAARLMANAAEKAAAAFEESDARSADGVSLAQQALWDAAEEARRIDEAAAQAYRRHGGQAVMM
ncbi:hypothetical protein GCM10010435_17100 [Winogradskya consettensis]|uniref:Uncharacterized protein n=1 Tax=Winogradskya consettensis TaxID=113560 RepID=A0A919SVG7_9ACTN|nr:hypothetical protein Aco04nite_61950 [Actinoplanes consettensis]